MRCDVGADDQFQPDATISTAVQNLRLVWRLDAQHPRQPDEDGERDIAGDRHRNRPLRARPGPGRARKPAGVRQDRRAFLETVVMAALRTTVGRRLKSAGNSILGWLAVAILKAIRLIGPDATSNI